MIVRRERIGSEIANVLQRDTLNSVQIHVPSEIVVKLFVAKLLLEVKQARRFRGSDTGKHCSERTVTLNERNRIAIYRPAPGTCQRQALRRASAAGGLCRVLGSHRTFVSF